MIRKDAWLSILLTSTSLLATVESPNRFDFGRVCLPLKGKSWEEIRQKSTVLMKPFHGTESRVVNDEGVRTIYQKNFSQCGKNQKGITIRFSQDVVRDEKSDAQEPLKAYEVFVKDLENNEVTGFALDGKGRYLDIVPKIIAFDKSAHKIPTKSFAADDRIRSRMGCFACHSEVSFDYVIPGADQFWDNARPVAFLEKENFEFLVEKNREATEKKLGSPLSDRKQNGTKRSGQSARLVIHVPPSARVLVDNIETISQGSERHFSTPPILRPGYFDVTAMYSKDGVSHKITKRVIVRPGEESRVKFH